MKRRYYCKRAQLDYAEKQLIRYSNLLEQKATSQENVDNWRYQRDSAQANLQAAEAARDLSKLNLSYTEITAPFDGRIDRRLQDPGNLVGSGQNTVLAEVNQIDPIYVYFTISDLDLARLMREAHWTPGQADAKKWPVFAGLTSEEGYPHQGRLDFASISLTPTTGTLLLRGIFSNPDGKILPGLYARVRVPVKKGPALLVPQEAIGYDQRGSYVLIVNEQNVVQRVSVRTGTLVDHLQVVEEGLTGKEWVVIKGLQKAVPGRQVTPEQEGVQTPGIGSPQSSDQRKATAVISRFFIERPIFANVIALVTVIIGLVFLYRLPVAQYPQIVPPTIQVTTRYPGASADVVAATIGVPIEQAVNGVEDSIYMSSTSSSDGSYSLTITFDIGTDLNTSLALVQNLVNSALAQLPGGVQQQGVTVRKVSPNILLVVSLYSEDDRFEEIFLSNYAVINLQNPLARLPGVGQVVVRGAGSYSMRVWLDPKRLQTFGITTADVLAAIQSQNVQVVAGQLGAPPVPKDQSFQFTISAPSRLSEASEFQDIIIRTAAGQAPQIVRLRDIARVDLSQQSFSNFSRFTGHKAALIPIFALPDANAIAVADGVYKAMAEMSKQFPEGLKYGIRYDTTLFVREAISKVYETLIIAGILVLIVILLFLQSFRAMLVPATTVPVTIIGAFIAMAALGFTVNLMTLFALILAVGIVVDDAIVIVENSSYYIERGVPPKEATIKAMQELTGPVMGITLALVSVFLPAAFFSGISGQIFRQFALVIASTAVISAINALTLKPVQCAFWLRPRKEKPLNWFYRGFNKAFQTMTDGYMGIVTRMVKQPVLMVDRFWHHYHCVILGVSAPAHGVSPYGGPRVWHPGVPLAGRCITAPVRGGG